jgi:hypothetical protein
MNRRKNDVKSSMILIIIFEIFLNRFRNQKLFRYFELKILNSLRFEFEFFFIYLNE